MRNYFTTNIPHTNQINRAPQPFKIGGNQPDEAFTLAQLQGFEPIGAILSRLPLIREGGAQ